MSEYLDQGRKKNHVAAILVVILIGAGVVMFMRRGVGPEPANGDVVNAPGNAQTVPVEVVPPVAKKETKIQVERGKISKLKTLKKSLEVKKTVLKSAVVAVGNDISAGLGLKETHSNPPKESVPLPPKEVIELAAKPASEGGLRCPAPGCPCGKGCVYTDITTPVISRNLDGSWNLKCSGVTDYNGKITPLTSIFKWDRGNMVMVSEFQAIE